MSSSIKNRLLRKITESDFDVLHPRMELSNLELKRELLRKGDIIDFVYFPEDCVISFIAKTEHVQGIEVGMAGFEGMSNMLVRPGDLTSLTALVQVAGSAWRVSALDSAAAHVAVAQ